MQELSGRLRNGFGNLENERFSLIDTSGSGNPLLRRPKWELELRQKKTDKLRKALRRSENRT